jgi:hypothetical protein
MRPHRTPRPIRCRDAGGCPTLRRRPRARRAGPRAAAARRRARARAARAAALHTLPRCALLRCIRYIFKSYVTTLSVAVVGLQSCLTRGSSSECNTEDDYHRNSCNQCRSPQDPGNSGGLEPSTTLSMMKRLVDIGGTHERTDSAIWGALLFPSSSGTRAQADVRGAAVSWRVVVALKSTDHAGGRRGSRSSSSRWLAASPAGAQPAQPSKLLSTRYIQKVRLAVVFVFEYVPHVVQ